MNTQINVTFTPIRKPRGLIVLINGVGIGNVVLNGATLKQGFVAHLKFNPVPYLARNWGLSEPDASLALYSMAELNLRNALAKKLI